MLGFDWFHVWCCMTTRLILFYNLLAFVSQHVRSCFTTLLDMIEAQLIAGLSRKKCFIANHVARLSLLDPLLWIFLVPFAFFRSSKNLCRMTWSTSVYGNPINFTLSESFNYLSRLTTSNVTSIKAWKLALKSLIMVEQHFIVIQKGGVLPEVGYDV